VAEQPDRPGIGLPQTLDDLQHSGLAGAVRAENPEELALRDREGHSVNGSGAAVGLDQIGDLDGVCHR